MANVTSFNINDDTLYVEDVEARNNIANLTENKQDKITVNSDYLSLDNNVLTLNDSSFLTTSDLNSLTVKINENFKSNTDNIDTLRGNVVNIFNKIINPDASTVSNTLAVNGEISSLISLKNSISNLTTKITTNTTNISNLSTTVNNNKTSTDTSINSLTSKNTELTDRLNWVEKEVFGSVYSDNTNTSTDSNSRIDNLERLLNLVVGACLKRNVLMSEDTKLKEYNTNASNYNVSEINTTNYSYS